MRIVFYYHRFELVEDPMICPDLDLQRAISSISSGIALSLTSDPSFHLNLICLYRGLRKRADHLLPHLIKDADEAQGTDQRSDDNTSDDAATKGARLISVEVLYIDGRGSSDHDRRGLWAHVHGR